MAHSPLYTPENCSVAYQLDWSLSIFWREQIENDVWLETLKQQTEPDGVRLLKHRFVRERHSQFLVSTKPHVSPSAIARSVKGRLQYLIQSARPKAFQRNYSIRAIGSTKRDKLDAYIASQLRHHPMADASVQARFEAYQIHNLAIDLADFPHFSAGISR